MGQGGEGSRRGCVLKKIIKRGNRLCRKKGFQLLEQLHVEKLEVNKTVKMPTHCHCVLLTPNFETVQFTPLRKDTRVGISSSSCTVNKTQEKPTQI